MFSVGGGGYARVFAGVSSGYRGTARDWSIEDAVANFDAAFSTEDFHIPFDAMDEAALYSSNIPWPSDIPWNAFRQFIV